MQTTAERFHFKANRMITKRGSKCTVFSKQTNSEFTAMGLVMEPDESQKDSEGYVNSTTKICYLSCKVGNEPHAQDVISFATGDYAISECKPIVIGDTAKGVIAYILTIGV